MIDDNLTQNGEMGAEWEAFARRKAGLDCPMCQEQAKKSNADTLIAELPSGRVYLKNDAAYRGYCILKFHRHAVELMELNAEERRNWVEDLARIEEAITVCCHPAKLNLAMLGNLVPHLHCHLMPRYPEDPEWGLSPTFATDVHPELALDDYAQLRDALSRVLKTPV